MDKPRYEFKELGDWSCMCLCSGVYGHGRDKNKTQAKKKAAFEVLERLFTSSSSSGGSSSASKENNKKK